MGHQKGSHPTGPVRCRNRRSATVTVSALDAAAEETYDITDADAEVGDVISVSPAADVEDGWAVTKAYVSAAGTIKVQASNVSGSSLTGGSLVLYYVIQA